MKHLTHHRWRGAVVVMGLCRGLVYIIAAVAAGAALGRTVAGSIDIHGGLLAVSLVLYVIVITIVARHETDPSQPPDRSTALAVPIIVLAPAIAVRPATPWWALVSGAIALLWLARAASGLLGRYPSPKRAVLAWLAGISLADAFFLTLLDRPSWALVAAACFVLTIAGHRRIPGT